MSIQGRCLWRYLEEGQSSIILLGLKVRGVVNDSSLLGEAFVGTCLVCLLILVLLLSFDLLHWRV